MSSINKLKLEVPVTTSVLRMSAVGAILAISSAALGFGETIAEKELLSPTTPDAFAHVVFGGTEWQTHVICTNTSEDQDAVITWTATDDNGAITAMPVNGGMPVASYDMVLPKGRTEVMALTTYAGVPPFSGSLWVADSEGDTQNVVCSAVFKQTVAGRPDFEAAILTGKLVYANQDALIMPFDQTQGYVYGVAGTSKLSYGAGLARFLAYDQNGVQIAQKDLPIPESGHFAFNLAIFMPETAGKIGCLAVGGVSGWIDIIGLRFGPTGAFTTVELEKVH